MKPHSTRNLPAHSILKVMPLAAIAFFLSAARSSAENNISTGDVYGKNYYNAASIASNEDGTNNLTILHTNTTSLTISKDVIGFVVVSNNFDSFSIDGSDGTLTTAVTNGTALSVYNGGNGTLTISEGTYSGGSLEIGTNEWIEAAGGLFSGVQTALVSDVTFEGRTLVDEYTSSDGPPTPGDSTYVTNASGSAGLIIKNCSYVQLNDSTVSGGDAGEATGYSSDMTADGGIGLQVLGSAVVLSNVTVTGGAGGDADAYGDYSEFANGGDALYADNAEIEIYAGTLTGGAAGSTNGTSALGGSALHADNSSVVIHSGTYSGSDSPAVLLQDSDLTTYGGSFTSGGLTSRTTSSTTNTLNLLGGTFSTLKFVNAPDGYQLVTASNITVSVEVLQDGGTVDINNLDDDGFQFVTVSNGTMIFQQDLTMNSSAEFNLANENSRMEFQGDLEIGEDAEFNVNLGHVESDGNITVLEDATISFKVVSTNSGLISTSGTVTFESNATVSVNAVMADYSTGTTTTTVIEAGSIDYGGFVTDVTFTTNSAVTGRTSLAETITNNNLSFVFTTVSFSNYWNATGQMAELADELEDLVTDDMNLIINSLGASASAKLVEETYFTTLNTFQTAKQGFDAAVGLGQSRGTEFREQLLLPKGAQGPELEARNDWRFWLKYYGSFYSKDAEGLNSEYDAALHGGVLGMDKSFGNLLVGLSAGAGNYSIDADNDFEQNMDAYQASLYSTWGIGHSYIDMGLAYGFNSVESATAEPFVLEGEFDAQLVGAHLGGGWGFDFPDIGTVITPEASVRYTMYQQDAYTESGSVAVPREFEEFDSDSLVGSVGLNAAMLNTTALDYFAFKVEGRAHWMREFNPDPGELNYSLVGGVNDYSIIYPYLDEDTIRLGIGFTFFNAQERASKNVLLRLDFDELFGDGFNSHNLSAKVIYAF